MKYAWSLAERAKTAIGNELERYPDTETGGLLLGYAHESCIEVIEATDAGYRNVIHEQDCFAYDAEYETHLCDMLSGLYDPPLELVGVWHKHNAVGEIPFSNADEAIHRQLVEAYGKGLSLLFEKEQDQPVTYRLRCFWLSRGVPCLDITDHLKDERKEYYGEKRTL